MRWVGILTILTVAAGAVCAQPAGVTALLCRWPGGAAEATPYEAGEDLARVGIAEEGPLRMRVELTCAPELADEPDPLALRLDITPRWPHYYLDIAVLDAGGQPVAITWRSAQRNQVLVPVRPVSAVYYVQVTDPRPAQPPALDEAERTVRDPVSGLGATICRWYDGRPAALSFRFDDSHPTHILKAVPLLREYGFTGTFFINPGSGDYQALAAEWAACAAQGDQEFANHSMHHRGAESDEEAEREIGDAARHIRDLFPGRSPLMAYSEGGGTVWTHTRPLREILDRHDLFDAYGIAGVSMADSYGERVAAYREGLDRAIERGEWFTALFHQIGTSISDENFAATLELTQERRESLWIAGMAAVHKYQAERQSAALQLVPIDGDRLRLEVTVGTDPALYDQPLTIAITLPAGWTKLVRVVDAAGNALSMRTRPSPDGMQVLFDVPPVNARYVVEPDQ